MADKRIDAHTNTTTVANVDEFIVDSGSNGTRNITYSNLKDQLLGTTSIATIGNSVTEAIYNVHMDQAVPKIDTTTGVMYLEGGSAFEGNIDSTPTAGSNNAVSSGGTKTYVDNAVSQLNDEIDGLIKFKDVTVNASTSGYAAPSSTAGGVWIEALASYEALGVSREKIIGIIPVDWSSITQPLSFYLGSTSVRTMLHNSSSIYANSSVSYVKIKVVYHS